MTQMIRLEEAALMIFAYVMSLVLGFNWWLFWVCLLIPDLSMLGYLSGPRIGAALYNLFHHRALALIIALTGYFLELQWLLFVGIVLFGHSSMDRIFGYGLKHKDDIKHTHLGWIGQESSDKNPIKYSG
ncbi:DUF4260 domain-containing protein [Saccharicrinis sp. FJH62]|uniref:DUF4260 domain-containing protein n=1 Tax=Saccharicrinis sp. FJH62 TaxID=3344657 RepID=UPI0035D3DBC6